MRRRLFWALFGMASLAVLLLVAGTAGVANGARLRATRSELDRAGSVVAELVAERDLDRAAVAALVRGERVERLTDELAALRRAAGGSEVAVVGVTRGGRLVARPAVAALGVDAVALAAGETGALGGRREGWVGVVVPVPGSADPALGVVLSRDAPLDLSVPPAAVAGVLGVVAAISAAVAGGMSSGLSRRLSVVASAAGRLAAGDLSSRAEVAGDDEVTDLAVAFNDMATEVEGARARERELLLAVGHDLRTPLTTIGGYAEALAEGVESREETTRIGRVLVAESGRLRRLIEDITLLTRLEAADLAIRPEPVDVDALVAEVVVPFADRAAAVGVRVIVEAEETGRRLLDPDRVGQILGNLLDNALRYTPEAGTVAVTLTQETGDVRLSVADTGAGIDPDDLPHVFERSYVARRYRGVRPEGSGLGLSIVERLVAAMGGEVGVESAPGRGTTFAVVLPAPVA